MRKAVWVWSKIRKVPLLGWLVGGLVLAVLIAYHALRRVHVLRQKLSVERKISRVSHDWGRLETQVLTENLEMERRVSEEGRKEKARLEVKRKRILEAASDLKSTSDLVNEVFGK